MKLAYFPGCKIYFDLKDYGIAVEKVMSALGITLVKLPFTCCGNPSRGKNIEASVLAAVGNLALARSRGLDILTPCKCCFGQLKQGQFLYNSRPGIKARIDLILAGEGLYYQTSNTPPGKIRHLLSFLFHDFGREELKKQIRVPLPPEPLALQHGCHALRPFSVTGFDNPFAPRIFRELVSLTGLAPIEWTKELECCGSPAADKALSLKILTDKQASAENQGAKIICTACTHCQIQYGLACRGGNPSPVPAVPYAVVLGKALALKDKVFESWFPENI